MQDVDDTASGRGRIEAALALLIVPAVAVSVWVATRPAARPNSSAGAAALPARGELATQLDEVIRSTAPGAVPDGAWYALVLSSELLGGPGDPRGVDTWNQGALSRNLPLRRAVRPPS